MTAENSVVISPCHVRAESSQSWMEERSASEIEIGIGEERRQVSLELPSQAQGRTFFLFYGSSRGLVFL